MADDSVVDLDEGDSDFGLAKPKTKAAPKATKKATGTKAAPKKAAAAASTKTGGKAKPSAAKKRPKPDSDDEASPRDGNEFEDESLLAHTPPKAKKAKAAPAAPKSGKKPLADVVNDAMVVDGVVEEKPKKGKRVSEQYQMISHLEHIVKRPDTYIGSTERTEKQTWVFNTELEGMEFRQVSYVPGLYKIFDEILVNAADNKQNDKNMDEIKVTIDREQGEISVWNNGRGIPIEIHSKQKIYIPEMIFGNLLSSSNYDDDQQKVTGGRNGYGAKLCNIFSTTFTLETADARKKKKYKQIWTQNMTVKSEPKITDYTADDYTKVTFKPDFAKFGMDGLDGDFEALAKRRVYDLAGTCKGIAVRLNSTRVPVRSFKKYMEMYTKGIKRERGAEAANDHSDIITELPHPRWEIGFAVSDGSFQQVSFVNSIATTSGGTHVNYVSDQICNKLAEHLKKKNKGGPALKINQIRNHIFLFVNCQIVNPAFTSQTKEQLTTKVSQFGSTPAISDDFMKKVQKTEVIANILAFLEKKADQILKKGDGGRRSRISNPKLIDANKAGTKEGYQCTLILTEGDSAKGLAVAGRSMVGPDLFGVFPLRGKLLNVRDASVDQISKNAEIQNIKNFMGLQHKKEYSDTRGLRYGHLMIMTDQDHDGSHIKGLLINFLQVAFPSLLKIPGFLLEFITPIVKTWRGHVSKPVDMHTFYTMPEYETFKEKHKHEAHKWDHKYYKGLGTSSTEDAQRYFAELDKHLKEFHTMREHEVNLIDLAFSKKRADERKVWLGDFQPGTYLDHGAAKEICFDDFVNKELILFSMADNIRSIPSMVDGLKPGQRKVLYTCFKRNLLHKDVKLAELAGSVGEMTDYAHGETSLQQTIVGLAQTFVGSNNLNCLVPSGNFGSRLQGGNDAASARYIYTRLSAFAKKVFHPADEPLLAHNVSDGKKIEPQTYVPVVPLVLINGADGIGTGWSSTIPNYNPEDIVANLRRMMDREPLVPMQPWFRGFQGTVQEVGQDRFKFSGVVNKTGDSEIEITELPIRVWTQDFKDKLEDVIKAEKIPSFIKDYRDYNTHDKVRFVIQMEDKHMPTGSDAELKKDLEEKFKLSKSVATSNLVAFDAEGRIAKYASVEDIMKDFFRVRIRMYEKRKEWQLADMQRELDKLSNQARFVQMIIDGKLSISKKKKAVLMAELKKLGFRTFSKVEDAQKAGEEQKTVEESESDEEGAIGARDYDYLLGMPLWSLTQERVEKLRRQIGEVEMEVDALIKLSKEDLWRKDLDVFIDEWRAQLAEEHTRKRRINNMGRRGSRKVTVAASGPVTKGRKGANWDDDDDFEDVPRARKPAAPKIKRKEVYVEKKQALLPSLLTSGQGTMGKHPPAQHDGNSSEPEPEPQPHAEPKEDMVTTVNQEVKEELASQSKPVVKADDSDDGMKVNKTSRVAKKEKPASKKTKPLIKANEPDQQQEVPARPAGRSARAAASKPVHYGLGSDSDDSNGDDLLGDITSMVKGLPGGPSKSATDTKSLFSSSRSKPNGSSTSALRLGAPGSTKKFADVSDDDDTNFLGLVPQHSPRRSINVTKNANLTDDEDEDEDDIRPLTTTNKTRPQAVGSSQIGKSGATTKSKRAPPSTRQPEGEENARDSGEDDDDDLDEDIIVPTKSKSRSTATGSKGQPASKKGNAAAGPVAAKKEPATKKAKSTVKKPAAPTLSPAAKAYQAKKKQSAKLRVDADEDENDSDLVNDLLDSPIGNGDQSQDVKRGTTTNTNTITPPSDSGTLSPSPAGKKNDKKGSVAGPSGGVNGNAGAGDGGARPARRAAAAAAAKKKAIYALSSDEDDGGDDDDDDEGGYGEDSE